MNDELKAVVRLVWLAVTLTTAGAIAAPFVLSGATIARWVPACESKRLYGSECALCGTTTGFVAISRGDWHTAANANVLAIPLFAAFSLNAAAALSYLTIRARRRPIRRTGAQERACK